VTLRNRLFSTKENKTVPLLKSFSGHVYGAIKEHIDFSELKCGERIGRGNFGEVLAGTFRGLKVAVKKNKISFNNNSTRKIKFFGRF